ncbi:MAG: tetratricopeptide repeat protein [Sphingobacterium sp.]|nr:tetratricopeptide repeat protein [Sphingobacterium sp.]
MSYYQLGTAYQKIFKYQESIPEFEKALEIYKRWGIKPLMINNYSNLITSYHKTGQYKKEKGLLKKAEKDFPNRLYMIFWQDALLCFTLTDTIGANRYIEKYIRVMKDLSRTDVSSFFKTCCSLQGSRNTG